MTKHTVTEAQRTQWVKKIIAKPGLLTYGVLKGVTMREIIHDNTRGN